MQFYETLTFMRVLKFSQLLNYEITYLYQLWTLFKFKKVTFLNVELL